MTCLFGMQDSTEVPEELIKDLIVESTVKAMEGVARRAARDNDPVKAELYEKQANAHWLKRHASVMDIPPHRRPVVPAFPFPNRLQGPPLGWLFRLLGAVRHPRQQH